MIQDTPVQESQDNGPQMWLNIVNLYPEESVVGGLLLLESVSFQCYFSMSFLLVIVNFASSLRGLTTAYC